eukprot:3662249-Heterocapsa_arctica.AAC.1
MLDDVKKEPAERGTLDDAARDDVATALQAQASLCRPPGRPADGSAEMEKQTKFGFLLKDMMIRKMRILMKPQFNITELLTMHT